MFQIVEQSDSEKMAMYMELPKEKLAEMLIQANKILDNFVNPTISDYSFIDNKLDLNTLKHIKLTFDIHSDHSSRCNGYYSLCKMIKELESTNNVSVNTNIISDNIVFNDNHLYCFCINSQLHQVNNVILCSNCNKVYKQK